MRSTRASSNDESETVQIPRWTLAAIILILIAASGFVTASEGQAAAATRIAAPLLVGLGFFPVAFALSAGRGSALGTAIVITTCCGMFLAIRGSQTAADLPTTVAWATITFGCLLGIVSPLLALGWRATAAAAWLIVAAIACGSLLFARGDLQDSEPILVFNPLVRVMSHGLGFDWLHAGGLYPRVGTHHYTYPDRTAGVLIAALMSGGGLVISGIIALTRRRPVTPR